MLQLNKDELRKEKPNRHDFQVQQRMPVCIILDNLISAFNIGSIFRLSDALLVEKIYICGAAPDIAGNKFNKTGRGAGKWVPFELVKKTSDAISRVRENGYQIVAIELAQGSIDYRAAAYRKPVAFVIGHERWGISEEALEQADLYVHIPMRGMMNSLNVATAAAVVLYDAMNKINSGSY